VADEELLKRGMFVDRYEIRELLGVGGQGQVYRAHDPVLKRPVVIKALATMTDDFLRRFTREAESISKMSHNNVVDILDFRVEDGRPYIVMEYLAGQDLAARLAKGPMGVGEAVDMVLAVCSGVFACHRRGVIHRDLKPKNVFLSQSADYGTVVKVLDFGIARVVQGVEDSITEVGSLVGTPRYMAPEQMRAGGVVDEKTDQYGVGMLLYVSLTRESPWGTLRDVDLVRAILQAQYPGPRKFRPAIPEDLEHIILKAMAVDRGARFVSVHALGQELLRYATPEGKTLWTGHFTNVPRPMLPALSVPLAQPMVVTEVQGAAGVGKDASETDTTEKDAPQPAGPWEKAVAAAPLVPTKILPVREGARLRTTAAVPSGPLQELRAMALPRGARNVAAEAAAPTTRTMNPRAAGADVSRPKRRLLVGIAGLAVVGAVVGLALWLPANFRTRPEARATTDAASLGLAAQVSAPNAQSPPQTGAATTRPIDPLEHEQSPKAARNLAATESAPAETRKKRSREGRKRPRLQFLDDGSPLLE